MPDESSTPPTEILPQTQSSPGGGSSPPPGSAKNTKKGGGSPTQPDRSRSFSFNLKRLEFSQLGFRHTGHLLAGVWAIVAATVTASALPSVQSAERNAQSLLFWVRGVVPPPSQVVILAIEEESLSHLSSWPLRRATYAQAIEQVMRAGAKSVAVDVIWDLPSSYGSTDQASLDCSANREVSEDDRQLAEVLQRYDGRITLAAKFNIEEVRKQGAQSNIAQPYCPFRTAKAAIGTTNFSLEPNQQIHRLGQQFLRALPPQEAEIIQNADLSSFAEVTLQAANQPYPPPQGAGIFSMEMAARLRQFPFGTFCRQKIGITILSGKGRCLRTRLF
ncbi:MAG: CHASE2 domain-containing protein [Leptolyngbyaceae cyanobacterium CSU_1_3]|nr:CHASE2 domain-containing protein [Leptolyngbyaceae cyanobacterium CSU_1_3]